MKTIVIGEQFSDDPSGRFYTDGNFSGEEFREEILIPAMSLHEVIIIDISTKNEGYGSSFLSEAFGGLVKYGYYTSNEVLIKIKIHISHDKPLYSFFQKRIYDYIKTAVYSSKRYESTKNTAIEAGVFNQILNYENIYR
ncbi:MULTISPECIES: STAS-like domain-containing protein [Aeromonas]|uniref:STAS-like domain-containing protein n=1 Tax=Aeromonas TaxID=642 RepID=UPI00188E5BC9|nr:MULTISPECIES: STAS-like domain-containing protein [Aeromonas]ELB2790989.1 STAS-like domain-containing protein [Aeromonas hydrophila]MBF4798502.1 DUF4325 domain-containing protein [Aeromonas hydrophila]MBL0461100.1 STAS-like domain-containing protein [Aeromonas dhakensis]MBL0603532.1 STAS-like domain-containing protein [Aeromonas dhakensis]MBL0621144.1 STAS-like domain-containing protein [Aeromonas dhakensis]